MKFALVFAAIVGLACAVPTQRSGLKDDFDELMTLIPIKDIIEIYHKYENDADINKVVTYLKSNDFAKIVDIVKQVPEVIEIVNYIQDKDVPIIDILNRFADLLGHGHWNAYTIKSSRSWRDMLTEVLSVVDTDKLMKFAIDKLANSEDCQNLFEKIASVDFQKLYDAALSHPEIVDLIARLNDLGVNVAKIIDALKSLFGWDSVVRSYNTRSLRNDMDDFLALIPTDQLIDLYDQYKNDVDIKRIVAYLKSRDFAAVAHIIAGVPEVRDLVNYLENKGLHVVEFLNKIADHLGLGHWTVYTSYTVKSSRTWRDFIGEAKQLVNVDEVKALLVGKLANSEDFQELYEMIASVDYKRLHAAALSHPEIRDALSRLAALGVDVSQIWELIKGVFGWE